MMSVLLELVALLTVGGMPMPAQFEAVRGENRVLVIFAPAAEDDRLAEQKRLLAAVQDGLSDRDMLVLAIIGEERPAVLHGARGSDSFDGVGNLPVQPDSFSVVLIGKDGGEKRRWGTPVEPVELFALIDAMPMRQREMREAR